MGIGDLFKTALSKKGKDEEVPQSPAPAAAGGSMPPGKEPGTWAATKTGWSETKKELEGLTERAFFENPNERLVFVDDGLARGAALMGRCMNSLGKPKNPIGGVRGGPCIMARRIKAGK